jgi:Uma2 family endonuclease
MPKPEPEDSRLKLGPADHGRPLSLDEFMAGDYEEGYQYELIDGKLYVSPQPNQPEDSLEEWLLDQLKAYAREHPEIINHGTNKARVFVPNRPGVTCPEPDMAAYRNYPLRRRFRDLNWQEVSPILVVEVLSHDDPNKDLVRNAELYFQVPSIKEYWVLDSRVSAERPSMRAHRRHGKQWRITELAAGDTYTTRLLPDFELLLDPLHE